MWKLAVRQAPTMARSFTAARLAVHEAPFQFPLPAMNASVDDKLFLHRMKSPEEAVYEKHVYNKIRVSLRLGRYQDAYDLAMLHDMHIDMVLAYWSNKHQRAELDFGDDDSGVSGTMCGLRTKKALDEQFTPQQASQPA